MKVVKSSGRFCPSGVGKLCFSGSAQVGTCLAGSADGVPERSEWAGWVVQVYLRWLICIFLGLFLMSHVISE